MRTSALLKPKVCTLENILCTEVDSALLCCFQKILHRRHIGTFHIRRFRKIHDLGRNSLGEFVSKRLRFTACANSCAASGCPVFGHPLHLRFLLPLIPRLNSNFCVRYPAPFPGVVCSEDSDPLTPPKIATIFFIRVHILSPVFIVRVHILAHCNHRKFYLPHDSQLLIKRKMTIPTFVQ